MSTVGQGPGLVVVEFSEAFRSLWADLAEEFGVPYTSIEPDKPIGAGTIAILVAAGGEEEAGLDYLLGQGSTGGPPTYLIGGLESHRFGVEALRRGAADYFALPGDVDLLRRTIGGVCEASRERQSGEHATIRTGFERIIGNSAALKETLDKASRILQHSDLTVLLGGETGTGKELLARAIHDGGPRSEQPFVTVNCAAIPPTLIESELFGHERGAFTDAKQARAGLFEEAHKGTLFLDEIGHLPVTLQGKLLRAIEEKRIRRVGESRDREVDVRIVAATHVNLPDAVTRGEFREDLYYRLNVVSLELPPLRERGEDLPFLTKEFVKALAKRYQLEQPEVTEAFLAAIKAHSWPGNVRELRHAIERALVLSKPGTLDPGELALVTEGSSTAGSGGIPFPATLKEINAAVSHSAVELHSGNKSAAARLLGISRARLQRLMDQEDDHDS